MSDIASGYTPYKEYKYNSATDKYELISPWVSASTVFRTGGGSLDNELNSMSRRINAIIDDDETEGDSSSTWSSEVIKGKFDALPKVNDSAVAATSLWSSLKTSQHILQSYMVPANSTVTLPRFEGLFALAHVFSFSNYGAVGVLDRWGGYFWIYEGICAAPEDGSSPVATINVVGDTVVITNSSNAYIAVYYFRTTYDFS